ncbi:MAG: shikimate kinase [Ilumatobacteraceae bacterium]
MNARHAIVLVGLMGSGKTTVGKRIAQELGYEFADSDDLVASAAGKSVRDMFSQDGEAVFRKYESDAIRSILADGKSSIVLATGGGAVISSENRTVISHHASHVVWLDASVTDLVVRTKSGTARPLLDGDAGKTLQSLSDQRSAWYEEVATLRIDTRGKSVAKVCSAVLEAIDAGADHD